MTLHGTIVLGYGRQPNAVLVVAEAPGKQEALAGRPLVGKTGQEHNMYLWRHNLSPQAWRQTNLMKEYRENNPDPTPQDIDDWTPVLEDEIAECQPSLIVAVGRHAMRWFLGAKADLSTCHGMPHRAGDFDPSLRDRGRGAVVLPIIHPASGFYDNDIKAQIAADYERIAEIYRLVKTGRDIPVIHDPLAGTEVYTDVSGQEFATTLAKGHDIDIFGFDTEGSITNGYPSDPWSLQVSLRPGAGMSLRCSRSDFTIGVRALQSVVNNGTTVAIHNAMFDIEMARLMGLELRDANLWDTMYASYLMRLEPQGLKALAYRWLGIKMNSYEDTVGDAGRDKQIDYLINVMCGSWPKADDQIVTGNDGESRLYKPQRIEQRAQGILASIFDDPETDVLERWKAIDKGMRQIVETRFGRMPFGTLADLPLSDAINYSVRDSDVTLRLHHALLPALKKRDLLTLMSQGMKVTPIFEEMQWTGMHASRSHFQSLMDDMNTTMEGLQTKISYYYFDKKPFNPASHLHVAELMRKRGLVGSKLTSTGKVSTGKKSIEHLRHDDKAISAIIDWRECQKVRDAFCSSIVERMDPIGPDLQQMRCRIKTTRVQTRRLATAEPNFLAMPARTELGKRVRDGYQTPEGEVFGAWDLSAIEMKVMAYLAKDKYMISRFNAGADVHSETAAEIFRIPLDKVDKMLHRLPAKVAGFGIINGISGMGLFDQLRMFGCEGWSVEKCDDLITRWFGVYPAIQEYMNECRREVRRAGVVRDMWGMYRYLPGAWSDDRKIRSEAERTASSHRIQGGAQGMLQNSMVWLDPKIRELQSAELNIHWCLQIHDELIFRFDEDLWEIMNDLVTTALTKHHGVHDMPMSILCEGHMAQSWGLLK